MIYPIPGKLYKQLLDCFWLDVDDEDHDWADYSGKGERLLLVSSCEEHRKHVFLTSNGKLKRTTMHPNAFKETFMLVV
jgi:hypothetical protein